MKTIGKVLKEARVKKQFSKSDLSAETKIKAEFIGAIEKENWNKLPDLPTVQGFVKSIAQALEVKEGKAMALLRRDYPPKDLSVNPKPDISNKFHWGPRLTAIAGVAIITLAVLGYLGVEYFRFVSPPRLKIDRPEEGKIVDKFLVQVLGKTDPDATIKVNNQPVLVKENGEFEVEIEITGETREIVVEAVSRSGKETTIRRNIEPRLD